MHPARLGGAGRLARRRAGNGAVPTTSWTTWIVRPDRAQHRATGGLDGRGATSAAGTFWGYAIGNAWFYAVGALLVLSARLHALPTPAQLGLAIAALAGGWVVLLALLVGETDEAFADVYSAAVSSQNLSPRINQRGAILAISAAGFALAAWLGSKPGLAVGNYEYFLLLLGSVFIPLFGVFVADYFVIARGGRKALPIEWNRGPAA